MPLKRNILDVRQMSSIIGRVVGLVLLSRDPNHSRGWIIVKDIGRGVKVAQLFGPDTNLDIEVDFQNSEIIWVTTLEERRTFIELHRERFEQIKKRYPEIDW